ncbi:MAG: site-2 protease family protein [Oscillospiraceae bacterium]|nr:site-2 protease family protein [Oscillospiraceae bacterium]
MDGLAAWVSQLQFGRLTELLVTAAAAVLCICLHETCHGLAALAMGDPTAKRMGRLSLNPLKHIDLMGLVMLVVAKFGWAKPVPIEPRYFRHPKLGMAITALAGPLSNVFLSALAAAGYTVSMFYAIEFELAFLETMAEFFYIVFYLSAGLVVFNLLPVPPLDGSKVLFSLLPEKAYWVLLRYERYGMLAMMVLLLTGVLDIPLNILRNGLTGFLAPISQWTLELLLAVHS